MDYDDISKSIDEIEAEMFSCGIAIPSANSTAKVESAFGSNEMSFEQWLANVFLPNARTAVKDKKLPKQSSVAIAAIRNFDGYDEMNHLISLLSQFDKKINSFSK